jgi:phosphoserine phosphatase RsbU/P
MRIRIPLAVSIALVWAASVWAQSAQIFVPQTDGWRVQLCDDPAWASPSFDDSSWTLSDLGRESTPRWFLAGRSRWYRKRIHLPDQLGAMQILVTTYDGSYEVYVDGRRVSPAIQPSLRWQSVVTRIYPAGAETGQGGRDVEVAIRSHLYDGVYFFDNPPFVGIGNPAGAARSKVAIDGQVLGSWIAALTVNGIVALAGLIVLSLYLQQRGRREYLWLGLCVLFSGLSNLIISAQFYIPVAWNGFLGDPCEYWFFAAYVQFVYEFVGRRPHRVVRLYQWALVAVPFLVSPLGWLGVKGVETYGWVENSIILPGILVPISLLIVWARRGNREAAVLIAPMLLANIGFLLFDIGVAINFAHPSWSGFPRLHLGLVIIDYTSAAQALFVLAIGLVIFQRFVRVSRDQVTTQAELEAARAVQQVLIPEALPSVQGFRIGSVYHPAQQVGGDFFQILPLAEGGLLAVVGDVSGKGMPAALTVALIVGTLRTLAETTTSPAQILAGLNRRLVGRSAGFTTCLAVRVLPGGQAVMASAGHLNPYISSAGTSPREIEQAVGLPLGLSAEADYSDVPLALEPGETLTFLSDGVVEARNVHGELFGFERARVVSARPADEIARTAETFGQEDDITVVTLTVLEAAPA